MFAPVAARPPLIPGPKPTEIVAGREPFTFAHPPTIRTSFAREDYFLEGEIAYGYPGKLATPLVRGSDVIAPAGSAAYGVPMGRAKDARSIFLPQQSFTVYASPVIDKNVGSPELIWCVVSPHPKGDKMDGACLFNPGLSLGNYDSMMSTAAVILDTDPYGGGEVVAAPFDVGGPARVRYRVQNLGKITQVLGQVLIGDRVVNQWGYRFGDIGRGEQPPERLFGVGGGVIGIRPDPGAKDHYVLRIVEPLKPDGGTPLTEIRNDSRGTGKSVGG
jgi:hypothetical protein